MRDGKLRQRAAASGGSELEESVDSREILSPLSVHSRAGKAIRLAAGGVETECSFELDRVVMKPLKMPFSFRPVNYPAHGWTDIPERTQASANIRAWLPQLLR